jgi:pimeloyl-ACP methyl ester carboxylesterase
MLYLQHDVYPVLRKSFGFSEFFLVAHDRGARVAHRLAMDHPLAVKKMMLLDICPTLLMYESTDMRFVCSTILPAIFLLIVLHERHLYTGIGSLTSSHTHTQ